MEIVLLLVSLWFLLLTQQMNQTILQRFIVQLSTLGYHADTYDCMDVDSLLSSDHGEHQCLPPAMLRRTYWGETPENILRQINERSNL